jgi:hypothetical protein
MRLGWGSPHTCLNPRMRRIRCAKAIPCIALTLITLHLWGIKDLINSDSRFLQTSPNASCVG